MTTWEEAMEQCLGPHDICDPEGCSVHQALATIRKHIEDQAEAIEVMRASAKDYKAQRDDLKGLIIDQDSKIDVQTHQLSDLMDANIYQQGRIEELEALLGEALTAFVPNHNMANALAVKVGLGDLPNAELVARIRSALHPSEPETG